DKGVKINLARQYKGFTIGAYATFTNSDKYFTSEDNKNYTNKGVFVRIPLEIFTNRSLKAKANYNISQSTRETGQYAKTSYDLDSIINSENNIKVMKRQIRNLEE
ncbi:YjbH domain-containing protein, partial [Poseidonibacter sp.]|uniref:YjbH domain-containing protein n=1 Tax=Poseidonibacter sp. TaxID=2321188 RepID=UPI003C7842DE